MNQKVKTIRSDNGTEFKNKDVIEFCGSKGIKREYSNARTPQQNGVAERKNRTLIEAARTMLADSFLPNTFWAEAVSTACYVLNRVLVTKPHNKTPYELLTGKIPIISYIRPFGCHVTILNTIDHLGKFAGKSDEGFLVGYSLQSKAFRVYNLETKRVEENLHITFLENKPNVAGKGPTWLFDLDYLTDSMNYHPVSSENQANLHAGQQEANQNAGTEEIIDAGDSDKEDESAQDCFVLPIWPSYSSPITPALTTDDKREGPREEEQVFMDELERLKKQEKEAYEEAEALRKKFETLVIKEGAAKPSSTNIFSTVSTPAKASSTNLVNTVSLPVSTASPYEGLSLSDPTNPEEDDSEIPPLEDIYQNSTDGIFTTSSYDDEGAVADFTNLETVKGYRLKSGSIDIRKKDERGVVVRNKARLVAQGHRQEEGIDYDEVFAPVARLEAIRIFLAFASYMGFIVYQIDMKSAFLYGKIDEEVYVSQPPGFLDPKYPQKVYKVVKALYGLHQVYVDDIIFGSTKKSWCDEFEALMKSRFQMSSMGELTFFLGLQVKQKEDGIFISQDKYVAEILKKFDFNVLPIETQKPLVKDEEASDVDVHLYRSTIGSLMYLTASRLGIMFAVCACSRFQVTLKSSHLNKDDYAGAILQESTKQGGQKSVAVASLLCGKFCGFRIKCKQLVNVPVPLDHFPVNTLTSNSLFFMERRVKISPVKVTPLFVLYVGITTTLRMRVLFRKGHLIATTYTLSLIPLRDVPFVSQHDSHPMLINYVIETSGENLGGHSSSDKSLSGNEGDMTIQGVYDLCLSLCKQVSDQAKEIQALKAQITKLKKQLKMSIKHIMHIEKCLIDGKDSQERAFKVTIGYTKSLYPNTRRKFAKGKELVLTLEKVKSLTDQKHKKEGQEEVKDDREYRKRKTLVLRKKMKSEEKKIYSNTSEDDVTRNDELRLHFKTIAPDEEIRSCYEWLIRVGQEEILLVLMTVLSLFDREDLNVCINSVMENNTKMRCLEGLDRVLWADLMVLFSTQDDNG
ncbi:putative ribonuclease H-like domain-containing protein [Tanacetum coccineum]